MDGSSIVDVSRVRSKLDGFQVGLSLSDVDASHRLYDGSKTIKVTSYYTVNSVLIVEGIGVVYSVDYKGTLKRNTLTGYSIRQFEVLPR